MNVHSGQDMEFEAYNVSSLGRDRKNWIKKRKRKKKKDKMKTRKSNECNQKIHLMWEAEGRK